jgi:hypothetical protein
MPRRVLVLSLLTLLLLVPATTAAAAAGDSQQQPACPPGYDLGARTFEQALPLYQEQLDAGLYTEADLAAGFANFDVNGNGILCLKGLVPDFTTGGQQDFFAHPNLFIDDPGGNPR